MNNQIVISTKYVIVDKKPILHVLRDEDGDWQVLGGQEVTEEDAMVVSLDQVIQIDPTVDLLKEMNIGYQATRNNVSSEWKIEKI